jgi:nucleoside-diphosphate-sugar epimerase
VAKTIRNVLVTGPAGQVGKALAHALMAEGYRVRALVHKTPVNLRGVQSVRGDISNMDDVRRAIAGVDAVCQLATTKEDPATFIDVSVRGTYNLLEAARETGRIQRWLLAGGDASMGNCFPFTISRSDLLFEQKGENINPCGNCS